MEKAIRVSLLLIALSAPASSAYSDEVTQWNQIMLEAIRKASLTGVLVSRPAAIVQAAVYDAVNGIERRFTPIHVEPAAAPGASRRAAAVQAAYASLLKLFPDQQSDLRAMRSNSLSAISSNQAVEHSQSIARGIEWGQAVADAIWEWRSGDGYQPPPAPFLGGSAPGQWRPTPPAMLPGLVPQLANVTPWAMLSPTQFLPPGPPSLTSARYTTDFNEVKSVGSLSSASRTADQTFIARFWASSTSPNHFWNPVAVAFATARHYTLSENSRLLAAVNIAIADAAIAVWNAKYHFVFWRPITAIRFADTDGNSATTADLEWTPLLTTPPYPEYPSGLVGLSAAAVAVLANFFGENRPFTLESNGMPGVLRPYSNFAAALDEAVDARVFAGIHFRVADEDAKDLGTSLGDYILANSFRPVHGQRQGRSSK